jgi:hypothetical protein
MSKTITILVLGDGNSIHTQKWIQGLSLREELNIQMISKRKLLTKELFNFMSLLT